MRFNAGQIESVLEALIGLPLWASGRAGDLRWFQFGAQRRVPSALAGRAERIVGDCALHVQCAWRIVGPDGRLVAWNGEAGDEGVAELLRSPTHVVESIRAQDDGRVCIALANGLVLEVVTDTSCEGEQWRLLKPGTTEPHFVFVEREE